MTHREASKQAWSANLPRPTVEDINLGSLQSIADACELMAKNYAALISDRERYERWFKDYRTMYKAEQRRASSLRGVITKLKTKQAALKDPS